MIRPLLFERENSRRKRHMNTYCRSSQSVTSLTASPARLPPPASAQRSAAQRSATQSRAEQSSTMSSLLASQIARPVPSDLDVSQAVEVTLPGAWPDSRLKRTLNVG